MRLALATLAALLLAGPVAAAVRVDLERDHAGVGEPVGLQITVIDAHGNVGDPAFDVAPGGLVIESSGTERQMSWVNGRSTSQVVFHYEIMARAAGTYRISNIRVTVGREVWSGPALDLVVEQGLSAAALRMDLLPADPYVGQPVFLRLRLIEHQTLEDWTPYAPENLTGFWSEPEGRRTIRRIEPGSPLRVVETRRRLYPLAAGRVTIGSANAMLTVGERPGAFGGPRTVSVESGPLQVRVRPLPPAAPADFSGAVGWLVPIWTRDRKSVV